jgi:hypothetical protein
MYGLSDNVFLQKEFISLVIFSIIMPVVIYRTIWHKQVISRASVFFSEPHSSSWLE